MLSTSGCGGFRHGFFFTVHGISGQLSESSGGPLRHASQLLQRCVHFLHAAGVTSVLLAEVGIANFFLSPLIANPLIFF